MFSFFSQVKVKRILFTGLVLVLLAGFLGGCKVDPEIDIEGELSPLLENKWVGASGYGDNYTITQKGSTGTLKYVDGYGDYEGNIAVVVNSSPNSGIIIVKYTKGAPDSNSKYTGVYYRNLTTTTVQLANAYNTSDWTPAVTATLEEAKANFTSSNVGNYVGMWGDYVKE